MDSFDHNLYWLMRKPRWPGAVNKVVGVCVNRMFIVVE